MWEVDPLSYPRCGTETVKIAVLKDYDDLPAAPVSQTRLQKIFAAWLRSTVPSIGNGTRWFFQGLEKVTIHFSKVWKTSFLRGVGRSAGCADPTDRPDPSDVLRETESLTSAAAGG